jgi:hypothetical protein
VRRWLLVECRCGRLFQVFSTARPNGNSDPQCNTRPHQECFQQERQTQREEEDRKLAEGTIKRRQTFMRNMRVNRDSLDEDTSEGQVRAQDKKTPYFGSEYPVGP